MSFVLFPKTSQKNDVDEPDLAFPVVSALICILIKYRCSELKLRKQALLCYMEMSGAVLYCI